MIKVSVICKTSADRYATLFKAISDLLNIKFHFFSEYPQNEDCPLILLDSSEEMLIAARESRNPFIAYLSRHGSPPKNTSDVVNFSSSKLLQPLLHGQSMVTKEARYLNGITISEPLDVLAQVQGLPIWVASSCHKNQYYTSVSLPDFNEQNQLSEFFNGEIFLNILPIYCFLRFCIGRHPWQLPPIRACIIVDDPNLHWTSYVPINYRNLLVYCKKQNIHISFATIPLDGWYVHPKAAKIFIENDEHLSLLVHGNNHEKGELAKPRQKNEALNYFAQALRRINSMEKKSGLSVNCVMIPPHGLISKSSASVLSHLGFEAICTNRWSLWKHIKPRDLTSTFGLEPAGFLENSMPVLNRFRMVSPICRNEIIIAALLGIPIIPYCHVDDFANSFSEIEKTVSFINELGQVCWLSISEILRSNYSWSQVDNIFQVRAYSNKIKIMIPDNTPWLHIEFSTMRDDLEQTNTLFIFPPASNGQKEFNCDEKILVEPKRQYEISIINHHEFNIDMLPKPALAYQTLFRRIGTELRDRLYR